MHFDSCRSMGVDMRQIGLPEEPYLLSPCVLTGYLLTAGMY